MTTPVKSIKYPFEKTQIPAPIAYKKLTQSKIAIIPTLSAKRLPKIDPNAIAKVNAPEMTPT
jgi:hypothetical protein